MANEINMGLNLSCANGTYSLQISRQKQITQAAIGGAGGVPTIAVVTGTQTLHGTVAKPSAICATTTTLPANTYSNGSSGVGATLTGNSNGAFAAVDGITAGLNQYVLVKNEVAGANNGLYQLTTVGTGGSAYVLTRVTAMDTTGEFVGATVYVESGSTNGGLWFTCTNASAPTLGSTSITFKQSCPGTSLYVGSVTSNGIVFLENLDTTNFITYGPVVGGVMVPDGKLLASEMACYRLYPGVTLAAVADTAAVKLYYELLQA